MLRMAKKLPPVISRDQLQAGIDLCVTKARRLNTDAQALASAHGAGWRRCSRWGSGLRWVR